MSSHGTSPADDWEPGDNPDTERAAFLASRANPDNGMACGCFEGDGCPHTHERRHPSRRTR